MFDKIEHMCYITSLLVKDFKKDKREDKIGSIGYFLLLAITMTSIIAGIVEFLGFCINGGYYNQIAMLKEHGLNVVFSGFTDGALNIMTSGIVAKIISILVIAEAIIMLVDFFGNKKYVKTLVKNAAFVLVFVYIIVPLFVWVIENVIPLITSIITIVILIFVAILIFSGSSKKGSGTSSPRSTSYMDTSSSKKSVVNNKGKLVIERGCAYIPDYNKAFGFKLFKVHGTMHDYIEAHNGVSGSEVCDIKQLKSGAFHIYESETGREIKFDEIPWRK